MRWDDISPFSPFPRCLIKQLFIMSGINEMLQTINRLHPPHYISKINIQKASDLSIFHNSTIPSAIYIIYLLLLQYTTLSWAWYGFHQIKRNAAAIYGHCPCPLNWIT